MEAPSTPVGADHLSRRAFLGVAAVVGASGAISVPASASGRSGAATFPLGAASRAGSKPVVITMWHSMTSANLTTLSNLTDQFNTSQKNVRVNLVNQNSYTDTLAAYTAALSGGSLPDLVQMQTTALQFMIDSQSIVPAQGAVRADHYSLSDYLPASVEFFRVNGTLYAMPFNISSNVLYYDRKAFAAAGLDPDAPPTSLAGLRSAAEKIVRSKVAKYGMSLKVTDSDFELELALADGLLVNHQNGRTGRATAVSFDNAKGRAIFDWWGGMLQDQLAQPTSDTTYDNLLAIGNRIAPMTWETSAALGTILTVLNSYPQVGLGVAPLPRPAKRGGVFVGGAGLFMVSKSPPTHQDAAWQFIKFLNSPASQATWSVGTGYVPIRKSATLLPAITAAWASQPYFKVAYQQIAASPTDPATAGAVIGAFNQVSNAINDGISSLASGTKPVTALKATEKACNSAIAAYNARI
ncbi:MAG TPA: extracellular solute-binding protein [Acidimicrobiales bacterium]|nr:extracellular solute-binding protein [Acidimicrobiales bacterium]